MEAIIKNWDAIVGLLTLLLGWIMALPKVQAWFVDLDRRTQEYQLEAMKRLALGIVADIYQETVRTLKAEGTFDAAAKRRVKNYAVERLISVAKKEGLNVAREVLPALVELAVNKLKGDAKSAAPFSPASGPASDSPLSMSGPELPDLESPSMTTPSI
jgi:hypothetical protein